VQDKMAVGVDLGGTKIRAGLVTEKGYMNGSCVEMATEAHRKREDVEGSLFASIASVLDRALNSGCKVIGIGVGSPGPLDLSRGMILNAPNLPSLNHYPLKSRIQEKFGLTVIVDNDANCFTLGEAVFCDADKHSVVVGLTLGTGLGCGIVLSGKVYHGETGTAAEIWKTPFYNKTVDDYFSGEGVGAIYESITGEKLEAREIGQKAGQGDEAAIRTWEMYGTELGRMMAWIVNLVDPGIIVLGGSMSNAFEFFQQALEASLRPNINPIPRQHLQIKKGKLGENGGFMGAAAQCF